jgi:hypothetical protein
LEGRTFTLRDLKSCLLAASGAKLTPMYLSWDEMLLWEIIEAIELVSELNSDEPPQTADVTGDWLARQVELKQSKSKPQHS